MKEVANKYEINKQVIEEFCDVSYDTYHQKYGHLLGFLMVQLTEEQREMMQAHIELAIDREEDKIQMANDMLNETERRH